MTAPAAVNPFPVPTPAPDGWAWLDYPRSGLLVQATTKWERTYRANACAKEPWTVWWIEQLDPAADVLWDIGASVGSYALVAGYRGVPTVAVEPGYASFAALCNNVIANRLEGRVTPLGLGVSDHPAVVPFGYRSTEAGAASHAFDAPATPKTVATLPVLAMPLDALVEACGLPAPTALKIDVDGAELAVLRGALRCLTGGRVRTLMIEVQDAVAERIDGLLAEAGFVETRRFSERNGKPLGALHYSLFERRPDS